MSRTCVSLLLMLCLVVPGAVGADDEAVRRIDWMDLIPEGWMPPEADIDHFFDPVPQPELRASDVPVIEALDGQRVQLPGYLVPLGFQDSGAFQRFLVVPYFGACIHVPPPPPNQIVFVTLPSAMDLDDPYGAHWVTGVLSTSTSTTELADAAYTMQGELVEPFDWQQPPNPSAAAPASR